MIEAPKFKRIVATVTLSSLGGLASCGGHTGNEGFQGGCAPYAVYAQDRWAPLGTAIRPVPDALVPETGSFNGDDIIGVTGWFKYGKAVYPTNSPPWDSNIWFKLAYRSGFVDFAGVRGAPTVPDPTGLLNGGEPAPTPLDCEGTYQP